MKFRVIYPWSWWYKMIKKDPRFIIKYFFLCIWWKIDRSFHPNKNKQAIYYYEKPFKNQFDVLIFSIQHLTSKINNIEIEVVGIKEHLQRIENCSLYNNNQDIIAKLALISGNTNYIK